MSAMRDSMRKWQGCDVSRLGDGGITGLKLATDDESVLMHGYVKLDGGSGVYQVQAMSDIVNRITESIGDENTDELKYARMATDARNAGRSDIGLVLDIISNEEMNHREILKALIPKLPLT